MDHHKSHLHQLVRALAFVLLFGVSQRSLAQSLSQISQVRPWHLGFSIGVPNLLEPVLQLDRPSGGASSLHWSTEARAVFAPIPLGSLATYIYSHAEALLRLRPAGEEGVFSVATGLGFQSLSLALPLRLGNLSTNSSSASATAAFYSIYWSTNFGWHWRFASGFRIGLSASLCVPFVGWGGIFATAGTSASDGSSFYNSSAFTIARLASIVRPQLQLLEMSWAF